MKSTLKNLGTIRFGSEVQVTDPCYTPVEWCSHLIKNALPGVWVCRARIKDCGGWGERVAALEVRHEDYKKVAINEYESGTLCVDSGQLGFFDADYYENHYQDANWDDMTSWYRRVCDLTCSDEQCGVVDNLGVVASSGYGDGCYDCLVAHNAEDAVLAVVLDVFFIELLHVGEGGFL